MVQFNQGESLEQRRVHVSGMFDNKDDPDKVRVALSMSNDNANTSVESPKLLQVVKTEPMLVYDTYMHYDGSVRSKYTEPYSMEEWGKIVEVSNKEGDALVFNADLEKNINGKGWRVRTDTLNSTDIPFDKDAHIKNTLEARAVQSSISQEVSKRENQTDTGLEL